MNRTRTRSERIVRSTILRSLLALAVVAALAGCKSNRNAGNAYAQAPQPAPQQSPYAYAPPPTTYAPPSYGPPPEVTYSPPPPAPPSDASDMTTRALEAERKAREVAEERARQAEEMLKLSNQQNAGGGGGGFPSAGGREGDAMAFAEELRTKCDAEIVQSGSSVVVRLSDAFRPGSDELKADMRQATSIHAVAEALMRYPGAQVGVIGHTDSQPIKRTKDKWSDNVHLSRARAETVARVLSEKGLDAPRMMVDGRGDTEPLVYPERTASDRSRNRRVEIHVRF